MSVMSNLATELELYWAPFGNGEPSSYTRQLPDGRTALLSKWLDMDGSRGWTLHIGPNNTYVEHYADLHVAMLGSW